MKPLIKQQPHRLDGQDFRNAEIALKRAAEKAQQLARAAGFTPVIKTEKERCN
jgi:hypothetical protein